MKFGIREICDVVLKAKAAQKIGNKIFYANEPVLYFDTLKSSSMEGASTTVYAQGGRGNTRLVAWEGERTVTFTMEDALISPEGFMILTGAGLIESGADTPIYQHMTETVDGDDILDIKPSAVFKYPREVKEEKKGESTTYKIDHQYFTATLTNKDDTISALALTELGKTFFGADATVAYEAADKTIITITVDEEADHQLIIPLDYAPYLPVEKEADYAYVMKVNKGEIVSEPIIPEHVANNTGKYVIVKDTHENYNTKATDSYIYDFEDVTYDSVIVDYYVEHKSAGAAKQLEISAESFGGNFYLEASTLFRDTNGSDLPAEFIIPNCKIQSNFNFSMASSGDPSTFTFTMDAFPDYTRFDRSKKVLAAIQILGADAKASLHRTQTAHDRSHEDVLKGM